MHPSVATAGSFSRLSSQVDMNTYVQTTELRLLSLLDSEQEIQVRENKCNQKHAESNETDVRDGNSADVVKVL